MLRYYRHKVVTTSNRYKKPMSPFFPLWVVLAIFLFFCF